MDSESGPAAWSWPVIGRIAVGLCAVANLTILGAIIAEAKTSSTTEVLAAMAPPSGRLGLLAFGVHAAIILGIVFAVNSLPGPGYGKSIFRRNDLSGLTKAAAALPLLAVASLLYWCGYLGVTYFAWTRNQPGRTLQPQRRHRSPRSRGPRPLADLRGSRNEIPALSGKHPAGTALASPAAAPV
ncbi:hypothetical protein AHiyo6_17890 [Arthrobacter sp. Hiyo6]|nr:hypothetical protein AHiyo6_17890 [Arthrobacter sp. Hiyo6]